MAQQNLTMLHGLRHQSLKDAHAVVLLDPVSFVGTGFGEGSLKSAARQFDKTGAEP